MAKKRGQGEGSVRLRRGSWWIRFTLGGAQVERKTTAESKTAALRLLSDTMAGASSLRSEGVTVGDLYALIVADYENRNQRVADVRKRWRNLEDSFGHMFADAVTTRHIAAFVARRREAGSAGATIQRDLACLRRIFRLAHQQSPRMVDDVPAFPTIRVDNVRQGFLSAEQFVAVVDELPDAIKPLAQFAYWTGWRRGELLGLRRDQVDIERGTARLEPAQSKTREGRTIVLPDVLRAILTEHEARTVAVERESGRGVRTFFHRAGKPIRDFYGAWDIACERAGVPDARFHDLRRTAARNYVRAGVHERVAMQILGHKTRSIFDRYNVTSEHDFRDAAERIDRALTAPLPGATRARKPPKRKPNRDKAKRTKSRS